jgi:hypothetical protein
MEQLLVQQQQQNEFQAKMMQDMTMFQQNPTTNSAATVAS